ncbi:MAG: hypothetical protein ACRD3Q_05870 [Terriglobales bacterium]
MKTEGSAKTFTLAEELLDRLKSWKQVSQFSGAYDWIFASPVKIGRLPSPIPECGGNWSELRKVAGIGYLGTHAFRHGYRSGLTQWARAWPYSKR